LAIKVSATHLLGILAVFQTARPLIDLIALRVLLLLDGAVVVGILGSHLFLNDHRLPDLRVLRLLLRGHVLARGADQVLPVGRLLICRLLLSTVKAV